METDKLDWPFGDEPTALSTTQGKIGAPGFGVELGFAVKWRPFIVIQIWQRRYQIGWLIIEKHDA